MKRISKITGIMLAIAMALTGVLGGVATNQMEHVKAAASELLTPGGVADFAAGDTQITIQGNGKQSIIGKQFQVHRLFDAQERTSINYTFVTEYETALKTVVSKRMAIPAGELTEYQVIDYIQSLKITSNVSYRDGQTVQTALSDYRYFVEELRDEIRKAGIEGIVVTVTEANNNTILLDNMQKGYYIVDEITAVEGTHSAASLCITETSSDNTVTLKSDYPTVTKKLYEDDGNIGKNDIGDYEIGQTVPFEITSHLPQVNGYHEYYWAWHDIMDEALTFNPDSVKVSVEAVATDWGPHYLEKDEYTIKTDLDNGETFVVEIPDVKAIICDVYGIDDSDRDVYYTNIIRLEYTATLNDKAAEDTGRPGFENDVRVEFSNDPDSDGQGSTGFTPWDTTVCFTYQLAARKINSFGYGLDGAKFRLYSDADCTNEVYVKQVDEKYIVINRDSLGGTDYTGGTAPAEAVEMVSPDDGYFTIYGLDGGTYYLQETEAPTGYRRLLDPIVLTVTPAFTSSRNSYVKGTGEGENVLMTLTATAYERWFRDGKYGESTANLNTDVNNGSMNLTVVNVEGSRLPVTGSVLTIVCLGLGTAFVGYSIYRKRKEDKCES